MVWPLNEDGQYSVKSGYHFIKDKEVIKKKNGASASHVVDKGVGKVIWKLQIPEKVKNFLW